MRTIVCVALASFVTLTAFAQNHPTTDTTIVFAPSSPDLISSTQYQPLRNAWGVDLMVSNNGFGLGGFWRHEYTDEISGFISLAISDVKDEGEVEYFDQLTGQVIVPYKKNRALLFPLTVGVQYRLFKDDIVDNFRPYVMAGVSPSLVFVAPYAKTNVTDLGNGQTLTTTEQIEFFNSLKYGRPHYSVGLFVGAGSYFGLDKGTLSGVSFRYYYIPYRSGIELMENASPVKTFGGFFITLNFGSMY